MGPLVDEACGIAEVARKGASDLEKSVDGIKTYFLKTVFNWLLMEWDQMRW